MLVSTASVWTENFAFTQEPPSVKTVDSFEENHTTDFWQEYDGNQGSDLRNKHRIISKGSIRTHTIGLSSWSRSARRPQLSTSKTEEEEKKKKRPARTWIKQHHFERVFYFYSFLLSGPAPLGSYVSQKGGRPQQPGDEQTNIKPPSK